MRRIAGIATLKTRETAFRKVIESIHPQVDEVIAVLNLYDTIPVWLQEFPKVRAILGDNSLTDSAKFLEVENCEGYYFSIDDDLLYPDGYCDYMIAGIEKYNGVVSLHGRIYPKPFMGFKKWSYAYRCLNTVDGDVHVNFIGSGCAAFNTKRLDMSISDFKFPRMADVWLSKACNEQCVPMTVLTHKAGYLRYLGTADKTIWETTKSYDKHNVIMKSFLK